MSAYQHDSVRRDILDRDRNANAIEEYGSVEVYLSARLAAFIQYLGCNRHPFLLPPHSDPPIGRTNVREIQGIAST
jgi:hypothetical protein